jgi:hypothetical protein
MQNTGEELVGEYLKWCCKCEFVEYNLNTKDVQGEVDVIGLNIAKHEVYVCEVAIHLETGLQYVNGKTKRPDNVAKLTTKFSKDYKYVEKYFPGWTVKLMFWSPIIKNQKPTSKTNQKRDLEAIRSNIKNKFGVELDMIVGKKFQECLDQLRGVAAEKTRELKSPVMRMLQIEEKLKKHLRV